MIFKRRAATKATTDMGEVLTMVMVMATEAIIFRTPLHQKKETGLKYADDFGKICFD